MHLISDNINFTSYSDASDVIEKLCSKYLETLETSMTESDFIFDLVQLMC